MSEQFVKELATYDTAVPGSMSSSLRNTLMMSGIGLSFEGTKLSDGTKRKLYEVAAKTAEWRRTYDSIVGVADMSSARVFSQGLGTIVKLELSSSNQRVGYVATASADGVDFADFEGGNKKQVFNGVRDKVVQMVVDYANTNELRAATVIKERPGYGYCDKCQFANVKLDGHAERCKEVVPGYDPLFNFKQDSNFVGKAYVGDLMHKMVLAHAAAKRGRDPTEFSRELIKAQKQAEYILANLYPALENLSYSDHSIGNLFEYLFYEDVGFRSEYARAMGFDDIPIVGLTEVYEHANLALIDE